MPAALTHTPPRGNVGRDCPSRCVQAGDEAATGKAPPQVRNAFAYWSALIAEHGLLNVRKIPGFHDEPIAVGPHAGERSVRLNRAWRAFYVIRRDGSVE